jgi:leucyl/phenylalanyl-tRNA--protein transferase
MWQFPDVREAEPGQELLALGGDMSPETLLEAYSRGLFPMNVKTEAMNAKTGELTGKTEVNGETLGWWSPDPRGVLPLDSLIISKSLEKSAKKFSVTFDEDFAGVMRSCQAAREDAWITPEFLVAYQRLHELGHAHSVEVRDETGQLVGGLYGVEIGGLFAGESMFHLKREASKVALVALVKQLRSAGEKNRLLDVQWRTNHLATLGVVAIPRVKYLDLLTAALPTKPAFGQPSTTKLNQVRTVGTPS